MVQIIWSSTVEVSKVRSKVGSYGNLWSFSEICVTKWPPPFFMWYHLCMFPLTWQFFFLHLNTASFCGVNLTVYFQLDSSLVFVLGLPCHYSNFTWWIGDIYAQSVILHSLPLKYDIKIVIILCQNLSILNAPVAKFLNELNRICWQLKLAVNHR